MKVKRKNGKKEKRKNMQMRKWRRQKRNNTQKKRRTKRKSSMNRLNKSITGEGGKRGKKRKMDRKKKEKPRTDSHGAPTIVFLYAYCRYKHAGQSEAVRGRTTHGERKKKRPAFRVLGVWCLLCVSIIAAEGPKEALPTRPA